MTVVSLTLSIAIGVGQSINCPAVAVTLSADGENPRRDQDGPRARRGVLELGDVGKKPAVPSGARLARRDNERRRKWAACHLCTPLHGLVHATTITAGHSPR
jgi:hypothetical protein